MCGWMNQEITRVPSAVHGTCQNPKPRGVSNMPWAALRCSFLDEDWGKHAWDNLLSICSRLQLYFVLHGVTGDFSSLDWSRWATKNEQVASLWFVLTHPQGIAPLSEEHALQFTLILSGSSTHQLDPLLASQFLNVALLAIGPKAATCQKGTIQVSAASS